MREWRDCEGPAIADKLAELSAFLGPNPDRPAKGRLTVELGKTTLDWEQRQ
jgi:hypothetical protein